MVSNKIFCSDQHCIEGGKGDNQQEGSRQANLTQLQVYFADISLVILPEVASISRMYIVLGSVLKAKFFSRGEVAIKQC